MNITPAKLTAECNTALAEWPFIWSIETAAKLPRGMLLAVGSRETNLVNEDGDNGHGHGVWQLDDRSHIIPTPFPVTQQATFAASMLAAAFAKCGTWDGAADMYNSGRPVDADTTGHDYGPDVMGRQAFIAAHYPATTAAPAPPPVPAPAPTPTYTTSPPQPIPGDTAMLVDFSCTTGLDGTAYVPITLPAGCTKIIAASVDVMAASGFTPPRHDFDITAEFDSGVVAQPTVGSTNPPGPSVRIAGGAVSHFYTGHAVCA